MNTEKIRLTQYSRGSGCGCKISPQILESILKTESSEPIFHELLVGYQSNDDAAVYDLGNGNALVSTTDFFTPIVDDAFDFGRIAAANAISDVYAMGGSPLMAIAILGWPVEKIPASEAKRVIDGARSVCKEANIPLAGGHSIDSIEPIFGLAVSGMVSKSSLKRNNTAGMNDLLFLTKPLGSGVLAAAEKRGLLKDEHRETFIQAITALNVVGKRLGQIEGVTAMTDITGFGLLGHIIEMAGGSNLSAEIWYDRLQTLPGTTGYITQRVFPDATTRNWNSYSATTKFSKGVNVLEAFTLLPDPQTNGGLLIAVNNDNLAEVISVLTEYGLVQFIEPVGRIIAKEEKTVIVMPSKPEGFSNI